MIKILNAIYEFSYYAQEKKIGDSQIKTLVKVPEPVGWVSKQLISFYERKKEHFVELTGNFENKCILLSWIEFNDEYFLLEVAKKFELGITKNSNEKISLILEGADTIPEMCFSKVDEKIYVIIYYLSRPDKIFKGELYVHGIWQVELSTIIKMKIGI